MTQLERDDGPKVYGIRSVGRVSLMGSWRRCSSMMGTVDAAVGVVPRIWTRGVEAAAAADSIVE